MNARCDGQRWIRESSFGVWSRLREGVPRGEVGVGVSGYGEFSGDDGVLNCLDM